MVITTGHTTMHGSMNIKDWGYFTWRTIYILIVSRSVLRMRNFSDKPYRKSRNAHFIFSNFFFSKTVPLMWKRGKILQSRKCHRYGACALHAGYQRLQRHARICNTCCFSTSTVVTRTHLNVTLYVRCLPCSTVG